MVIHNYLWISINELWLSINDFWISINELWISMNKEQLLKRHPIHTHKPYNNLHLKHLGQCTCTISNVSFCMQATEIGKAEHLRVPLL